MPAGPRLTRFALLLVATVVVVLSAGGFARADAVETVRDFGAIGDGVADDTDAIQRMIDEQAGSIRLPRGRYRITRPIVIQLDRVGPTSIVGDGTATIVMAGSGPALRFIGTHEGTAAPHTVRDEVWQRQRSPMVDGIEIVGDHAEAVGIEANGTIQLIASRLTIRRTLHAIHLVKRNRNVIISECHLYENSGVGLFLDGVDLHQINVANSHISYNGGGGIVVRGSEVRNLQIGTCDIEGNMSADGPATANVLIDASTGSMREGAIVGCTIQHTRDAPDSANIRFIGRGREDNRKVGNFTIADNVMSDVGVNIDLRDARGVTITGNTLWRAFAYNLVARNCSHLVVGSNLLDRNPDYMNPEPTPNAVLLEDCTESTITGLLVNHVVDSPAGVVLRRCRWLNVTGCSIFDCDNMGLLLEDVSHTRVSGCSIRRRENDLKPFVSLKVRGGERNMIVDNYLVGGSDISEGVGRDAGNYDGKSTSGRRAL